MADIAEILTRWQAAGLRLRLEATKTQWRIATRNSDDVDPSYIRPGDGSGGYATPLDAAVAGDAFLTALAGAQQEAKAKDQITAVERVLFEDRLQRKATTNPDGSVIVKWRIKQNDGTNFPGSFDTPHEAALAWIAAGAP